MWITPQRQLFIGHEVKLMQILLFDGSNVIWKTRCSAATTDVTEFPMIALNWFEKEPVPLLTGLVVIHLLNVKLIVLRWIKCNSIIVFFFWQSQETLEEVVHPHRGISWRNDVIGQGYLPVVLIISDWIDEFQLGSVQFPRPGGRYVAIKCNEKSQNDALMNNLRFSQFDCRIATICFSY